MPDYVLSLSYGKDSLACLGAIEQLGWPLDRIIHAEVWATDTIPAELPPMIEFKKKADTIIKARYGIEVEHIQSHTTYEQSFYGVRTKKSKNPGVIYGWPTSALKGAWCSGELKQNILKKQQVGNAVYLGIAADEAKRIKKHSYKQSIGMPLVKVGWSEADCREWCRRNGLLSPIYTDAERGGCWFCHNQRIEQLRLLRKNYPEYWALMLKWDKDSPVTFRTDGHTIHDFERRFQMEDDGLISSDDKVFRWTMLDAELNYRIKGV